MMFNVHKAQWWNAASSQMFEAYYMTLRVHYGMTASDAFATAKANKEVLGIGMPGGFIGLMKQAINKEK
jgi:hypothetical protein